MTHIAIIGAAGYTALELIKILLRHPEAEIRQWISAYCRDSAKNRLACIDGSPIFGAPLVGYADGDDGLFASYREIIGPFHRTPREVMVEEVDFTGYRCFEEGGEKLYRIWVKMSTNKEDNVFDRG